MKRAIVFFAMCVFMTGYAFADVPTKVAVGYDGGLSVKYFVQNNIGIQGIVGLNVLSLGDGYGDTDADTDFNIGGNIICRILEDKKMGANLNVFGGVDVGVEGSTIKNADSITDVNLKLGLEPEKFLSERLSISVKFGIMLNIAGESRGADGKTQTDTGSISFRSFGDTFGQAAIHWYF
jgi:hypothetical protein